MNLVTMVEYSLKEIARCKSRSVTTIAGYFLAIVIFGMIISMISYSAKSMEKTLSNTGTHFISFRPQCCGLPYVNDPSAKQEFIANGILSQPLPVSYIESIKLIPEVKDASPFLSYRINDPNYQDVLIGGFDPSNSVAVSNTSCNASDIVSGRFLNVNDHESIIIEESFARHSNLRRDKF